MKQVSHPPFLGIVDAKSGVRFFIRATEDPFFAPKITENGRFRVQKIGSLSILSSTIPKNGG